MTSRSQRRTCTAAEHSWTPRRYDAPSGPRDVQVCELCGTIMVALPDGRPRHEPVHAARASHPQPHEVGLDEIGIRSTA